MNDDDMTEEEFDAAFAAGEPVQIVVPREFRCDHMSISIGVAGWVGVPQFGCGCKPAPVFAGNR